MNIFELFWLAFFAGGGAAIGSRALETSGALVGGVSGFLLMLALGRLTSRQQAILPACRCGVPYRELSFERDPTWRFIHRCQACGGRYIMRSGSIWDSISPEGVRTPFMRRRFLGKWHLVGDQAVDGSERGSPR